MNGKGHKMLQNIRLRLSTGSYDTGGAYACG